MTKTRRGMLALTVMVGVAIAGVVSGCGSSGDNAAATSRSGASTSTAAASKKQPIVEGSFNGKKIKYFDFDTIKLVAGNKVAPIWTVTGGAAGQDAIVGSIPGSPDYSALHKVSEVTWKSGATPRLLTSVQDVTAAAAAGDVTVTETERVINAPLLEFGQERHAGYAKGQTIHYYELGKVKVAPGNAVLPIWTFTNGVSEQTNIADTEPGTTAYPPLWEVVTATWKIGVTPRLITSFEDMKAAEAAGQLTLAETPDVVNCPFL